MRMSPSEAAETIGGRLKAVVRRFVPRQFRVFVHRRLAVQRARRAYRGMGPSQIFDQIYEKQMWGRGEAGGYYSGDGSAAESSATYEALVADFVRREGIRSVLDFGCGDFQVSNRIRQRLGSDVDFTGLDASGIIVRQNLQRYPNARFLHDDGTCEIPHCDLVTVRQVFQHNSNQDIARILRRLEGRWRFLIVAEHIPFEVRAKNVDMPTMNGTRLPMGSGVFLDAPPFDLPVDEEHILDLSNRGRLRVTITRARQPGS